MTIDNTLRKCYNGKNAFGIKRKNGRKMYEREEILLIVDGTCFSGLWE